MIGRARRQARSIGKRARLVGGAKAAAHGVIGGLSSLALGGIFISGFAAGSVAQVVGGGKAVQSLGKAGQAITRIMAGGLAAMAGGGKFANGAITAAAAYAFNDLAEHAAEQQQVQNSDKQPKNSCSGTLSCYLVGEMFAGYGRVEVDGWWLESEKIGWFSCKCSSNGIRTRFYAPGEKRNHNLYGVKQRMKWIPGGDHGVREIPIQYKKGFKVNPDGFIDRWRYKHFLRGYENGYASPKEVREAYGQ